MSDPLEETISLSDMTEITETEGPRATQYQHASHYTPPTRQAPHTPRGAHRAYPVARDCGHTVTTVRHGHVRVQALWLAGTGNTSRFGCGVPLHIVHSEREHDLLAFDTGFINV
jgi:hypothetical protein